jgi:hypothetical protein
VSGGREGKVELQEKRLMIFAYSGNLNLFRLFTHTHTHTHRVLVSHPYLFQARGWGEYFLSLLLSFVNKIHSQVGLQITKMEHSV